MADKRGEGTPTMRCEHCGDIMRPETTIRLRRSFGFIAATHCQSAYCAHCRISVIPGKRAASTSRSPWHWARLVLRQGNATPTWTHA
jgi:RNase P subunit RPR2